jgi:hypothetical protein
MMLPLCSRHKLLCFWFALSGFLAVPGAYSQGRSTDLSSPMVLVNVDHRQTISLNGDWHTIADPYATGLYNFHGKPRTDGYFMNGKQEPGGEPVEYDFQRLPTLHVPGDWNTQRESLFFYEGTMWHEKDFSYVRKPTARQQDRYRGVGTPRRSAQWSPDHLEYSRAEREGNGRLRNRWVCPIPVPGYPPGNAYPAPRRSLEGEMLPNALKCTRMTVFG